MASSQRGRKPSISEEPAGKRFLIVCEGKKTEFGYFESIRQSMRLQSAQIIVVKPDGTDPLGIVTVAIDRREYELRKRRWNYGADTVWAVFDGDEHIFNNRENWDRAIALAKREKVKLAITNPAFEYWYLLHFRDHNAHLTRQAAYELVKSHVKGYEKAAIIYRSHLVDRTLDAIARAKRLHDQRDRDGGDPYANPCAHVCYLVEELLALSRPR